MCFVPDWIQGKYAPVLRTFLLSLIYLCCLRLLALSLPLRYTTLLATAACYGIPFYFFRPSSILPPSTSCCQTHLPSLPNHNPQTRPSAFLWENINSTLDSHQAKCYMIVLCACWILFPIYTHTNCQQWSPLLIGEHYYYIACLRLSKVINRGRQDICLQFHVCVNLDLHRWVYSHLS
jgi:hypothetical protein